MPRTPSPWVRTTLYRLVELQDLQLAIKPKYLEREGFFQQRVEVGGRDALLIYGSMITESVSWADRIHQLTGVFVDMENRNGAAVLLISNKKAAWALTYGMGFQLLEDGKVDPGFGQRVVIRTANIDSLNSLTRTTLDHRSRTDRFSIPGGEHLRGFGVGEFGELVTRMVGKARIKGITADDAEISLRGADALSLPLAREPHALVADLDVIESVLSRSAPPILSVLEQLSAIKHQPGLTERLDAKLGEWLAGNSDVGRVGRQGLRSPRHGGTGLRADRHGRGQQRGRAARTCPFERSALSASCFTSVAGRRLWRGIRSGGPSWCGPSSVRRSRCLALLADGGRAVSLRRS